jgi:hypothetical protein
MKNISEAFSFPFKDPDWVSKFMLGAIFTALSVVLIGIPVLYGYYIELMQRMSKNEQYPLPEWREVGVKFIVGIKYLIVLLVYYLPMMFVLLPVIFLLIVAGVIGTSAAGALSSFAVLMSVFIIVIPYSLFIAWLTPLISIRYAERESMGDALNLAAVFGLFKFHWQDALLAAVLVFIVKLLSAIGIIFLLVGVLFTSFYASLVAFHLYGQIGQNAKESSHSANQETL